MEKYILVHQEYEDAECIHDFIAIFPDNASDEEIKFALEKEQENKVSLFGKVIYNFTQINAFHYESTQMIRTFTKVVK